MVNSQECPSVPPNSDEVEALYPSGTSPELRVPTLSALCSYGQTPLVLTGALRQVLCQHFSDVRNILNATLRTRLEREGVWKEGTNTGILIESLQRWRPELTESQPGLILKEGTWTWQRMGIGDRQGEDYRSGKQFFGGFWNGTHTIFALATEGAEAQILAIEAMKCMQWFGSEIATALDLQRFVPVSIGEVGALQEAREHYVVPITVGYVVSDTWYIQPDAPRLKRVIIWRASAVLPDY